MKESDASYIETKQGLTVISELITDQNAQLVPTTNDKQIKSEIAGTNNKVGGIVDTNEREGDIPKTLSISNEKHKSIVLEEKRENTKYESLIANNDLNPSAALSERQTPTDDTKVDVTISENKLVSPQSVIVTNEQSNLENENPHTVNKVNPVSTDIKNMPSEIHAELQTYTGDDQKMLISENIAETKLGTAGNLTCELEGKTLQNLPSKELHTLVEPKLESMTKNASEVCLSSIPQNEIMEVNAVQERPCDSLKSVQNNAEEVQAVDIGGEIGEIQIDNSKQMAVGDKENRGIVVLEEMKDVSNADSNKSAEIIGKCSNFVEERKEVNDEDKAMAEKSETSLDAFIISNSSLSGPVSASEQKQSSVRDDIEEVKMQVTVTDEEILEVNLVVEGDLNMVANCESEIDHFLNPTPAAVEDIPKAEKPIEVPNEEKGEKTTENIAEKPVTSQLSQEGVGESVRNIQPSFKEEEEKVVESKNKQLLATEIIELVHKRKQPEGGVVEFTKDMRTAFKEEERKFKDNQHSITEITESTSKKDLPELIQHSFKEEETKSGENKERKLITGKIAQTNELPEGNVMEMVKNLQSSLSEGEAQLEKLAGNKDEEFFPTETDKLPVNLPENKLPQRQIVELVHHAQSSETKSAQPAKSTENKEKQLLSIETEKLSANVLESTQHVQSNFTGEGKLEQLAKLTESKEEQAFSVKEEKLPANLIADKLLVVELKQQDFEGEEAKLVQPPAKFAENKDEQFIHTEIVKLPPDLLQEKAAELTQHVQHSSMGEGGLKQSTTENKNEQLPPNEITDVITGNKLLQEQVAQPLSMGEETKVVQPTIGNEDKQQLPNETVKFPQSETMELPHPYFKGEEAELAQPAKFIETEKLLPVNVPQLSQKEVVESTQHHQPSFTVDVTKLAELDKSKSEQLLPTETINSPANTSISPLPQEQRIQPSFAENETKTVQPTSHTENENKESFFVKTAKSPADTPTNKVVELAQHSHLSFVESGIKAVQPTSRTENENKESFFVKTAKLPADTPTNQIPQKQVAKLAQLSFAENETKAVRQTKPAGNENKESLLVETAKLPANPTENENQESLLVETAKLPADTSTNQMPQKQVVELAQLSFLKNDTTAVQPANPTENKNKESLLVETVKQSPQKEITELLQHLHPPLKELVQPTKINKNEDSQVPPTETVKPFANNEKASEEKCELGISPQTKELLPATNYGLQNETQPLIKTETPQIILPKILPLNLEKNQEPEKMIDYLPQINVLHYCLSSNDKTESKPTVALSNETFSNNELQKEQIASPAAPTLEYLPLQPSEPMEDVGSKPNENTDLTSSKNKPPAVSNEAPMPTINVKEQKNPQQPQITDEDLLKVLDTPVISYERKEPDTQSNNYPLPRPQITHEDLLQMLDEQPVKPITTFVNEAITHEELVELASLMDPTPRRELLEIPERVREKEVEEMNPIKEKLVRDPSYLPKFLQSIQNDCPQLHHMIRQYPYETLKLIGQVKEPLQTCVFQFYK
eukprot:TRINITY_DN2126_c0_g1_i9.p1 TRINITY_DN2126_c0_g1~~TRINITY_DN2126_c0_g1_i9.p1  ORF type:complete len:1541 (-),score=221.27 TRINITY_DN2126_c0_g1_i9:58-4599(-)